MLKWHNERRKVSELIPYEGNPRQITEKQAEDLKKSLERFDLVEIPAIDTDNKIVAGHQRLKIMQSLGRGEEEIDVRVPSRKLTDKEFREYNLRSNKNTGEWDWDALANFEILELKEAGFSQEELDKMILNYGADEKDDVIPESVPAKAKLGEIYQLGNHKIMCGDSTKKEDVERLMEGKKADMVMSDPPYNVEYSGGSTNEKDRKDSYKDKWTDAQYVEFLQSIYQNAFDNSKGDSALMIWFASAKMRQIMDGFEQAGWTARTLIVWNKLKAHYGALGAQYKHRMEPLWYCHKKGKSPKWFGATNETTVWDYEQPRVNDLHPTMKPVEIYVRCLKNHSKEDDIVYETFLGSGTTLIAAEKTGRICYGMELEPRYIDTIIARWETYTGLKAVLISQGEHGETRESLRSGAEIG